MAGVRQKQDFIVLRRNTREPVDQHQVPKVHPGTSCAAPHWRWTGANKNAILAGSRLDGSTGRCVAERLRSLRSSAVNRPRAPVAQLDRVLPSEGRGRTFESCRARQLSVRNSAVPGPLLVVAGRSSSVSPKSTTHSLPCGLGNIHADTRTARTRDHRCSKAGFRCMQLVHRPIDRWIGCLAD